MNKLEPRQTAHNMIEKYKTENPRTIALEYRNWYYPPRSTETDSYNYWNAVIEFIDLYQQNILTL
jgi:hypothetical protein